VGSGVDVGGSLGSAAGELNMTVDTKVGDPPAAELLPTAEPRSCAQAVSAPAAHIVSSNTKPRPQALHLCRFTAGNFIMLMPV
jgi:hypothetical protein